MPRRMAYDRVLFFTAMAVVIAGLIMVGSSSNYAAMQGGKDISELYLKQAGHVALGLIAFFVGLSFRYRLLADRGLVLAGLMSFIAMLSITFLMPAMGGASRWITLGTRQIQPSEFAKLFVVVFMAYLLAKREDEIANPMRVILPTTLTVGVLVVLVVIEDLGSATIMALICGLMLFVAGLPWRFISLASAVSAGGFVVAVLVEPYRIERVVSFLDPEKHQHDGGFQLYQSIIAIGNGGLTGVGLGQGQQKAHYVYASHTDFIFATIGEEIGLIGTLFFLLAFCVIFWRGMKAAMGAPDRFGFYLAFGLTCMLVGQAFINMCVCIGMLPTKGLTLPFVSYGGSSLLASMGAMGLLLNVSQHSN